MSALFDKFEDIALDAILAAEAVECSLEDFRAGLIIIVDEVRSRLSQVNDEIASLEHGGEGG